LLGGVLYLTEVSVLVFLQKLSAHWHVD
jgi:hypothetical protein